MRVSQIVAHTFGPLHDQVLDLAEGLTVVVGDNESGKSSWHAAIYAALCGRRRRRGKPAAWEARFTERHRPWDGDEWLVTARISLDDGRRVELRQDLDGKVDCGAIDLDTGEDVSAEIIVDGAPDATRWLGLERASFLATACVEQAQLLRVRDEADGLAQAVQRAADTAGTDATAAEALRLIDAFRREHVGTDRSGSVRPLRRALDAVDRTGDELERARAAHAEYLTARRKADELAEVAELAEARAAAAETALADARAQELRRRAQRAVQLSQRLASHGLPPGGRTPAGGPSDAETQIEADVDEALAAWYARPEPVELSGPTSGELRAQLAGLPDTPAADPGPRARDRSAPAASAGAAPAREARRAGGATLAGLACGLAGVAVLGGSTSPGPGPLVGVVLLLAGLACGVVAGILARAAARARGAAEARRAAERTAGQRAHLQARLQDRLAAEQVAAQVQERRLAADRGVLDVAARLDLVAAGEACSAAGAVVRLADWRTGRRAVREALAAARAARAELDGLLAGASLDGLVASAEEADATAQALRDRFGQRWPHRRDLLAAAGRGDPGLDLGPGQVTLAYAEAARARAAAAGAAGECAQLARSCPTVAEAEEAHARAGDQLASVRRLDDTLRLTGEFLTRAQTRVHHDVAPVLGQSVRRWLPRVTQGRYQDVAVDPATLTVRVTGRDRRWHDASTLSHGTAEQIYLLLRLALVEHLTRGHDTTPLLFDEITVYADPARTAALLDLVADIADERQVVLFTQEEQVAAWAREHLGPRDRMILLPVLPAG